MKKSLLLLVLLSVSLPATWAQFGTARRIIRLATAPACAAGAAGLIYYDTSDNKAYFCDGTAWQPLGGTALVNSAGLQAALSDEFGTGSNMNCTITGGAAGEVLTLGSATTCVNAKLGSVSNAQAAGYAILDTDRGKTITTAEAGAQAFTIAQAGAGTPAEFIDGWYTIIAHSGTGTITITPTTSTCNGAPTCKVVGPTRGLLWSNGTNYFLWLTVQPALGASATQTIASGAKALATAAIASGTCTAVQTDTATNAVATDGFTADPSADPTVVTGYAVSATGSLYVWKWLSANTVNFRVCNNTAGALTPGALTMNWRVVR